jgi:hypothetical protein
LLREGLPLGLGLAQLFLGGGFGGGQLLGALPERVARGGDGVLLLRQLGRLLSGLFQGGVLLGARFA